MKLTIIIPTANRPKLLKELLVSLSAQQQVEFCWEVIVVDNAPSDETQSVVSKFATSELEAKLPSQCRYVCESSVGLHFARHRGIAEARGEYVGFLDDDMILSTSWILGARKCLSNEAQAVVGRIYPHWEAPAPDWLLEEIRTSDIGGYLGLLDLGEECCEVEFDKVFAGNAFFKKDTIVELGGFNPDGFPPNLLRYRGDGETGLMKRFANAGFKAFYDPIATAYHVINKNRMTIDYLCQRSFNQGISDSFTALRETNGDLTLPNHILNRIKKTSTSQNDTPNMREKIAKSYLNGWSFHRKEVLEDAELLNYVLKRSFM